MKKALCALLILCLLLPVCALADGVVNVFNWEEYIAEETLEKFYEETGIEVKYMRFTDNEQMMIDVETNVGAYDVAFPSEYAVQRLMRKGLLAEINYDNIPNVQYIREDLRTSDYDPQNAHNVPYMWGTLGILYDTEKVDEADVHTWSVLWSDKYAGDILMMDSLRDAMGIALRYLGYSMNSTNYAELRAAADLLIKQKEGGYVKAYGLDEFQDKMAHHEAAMAVVYSGDAQYAIEEDEKGTLAYIIPDEGSNVWVDSAVIPASAKNKENAEAFINFLCRPDIAALNAGAIGYCSPIPDAVALLDEAYQTSEVTNPSDEILDRCEVYIDLNEVILKNIYIPLYDEVLNAKVQK